MTWLCFNILEFLLVYFNWVNFLWLNRAFILLLYYLAKKDDILNQWTGTFEMVLKYHQPKCTKIIKKHSAYFLNFFINLKKTILAILKKEQIWQYRNFFVLNKRYLNLCSFIVVLHEISNIKNIKLK